MSLIDSTAERFLRIAAARWPAELRDDQSREWAAELHAIRNDGTGRWRRGWAQLRFGLSLATSPPVDDPHHNPYRWREVMPRWGHAMGRAVVLVAVGAVCIIAQSIPRLAYDNLGRVYAVLGAFAVAAVLCEAGRRLGRALPLSPRDGRGLNAAATATVVVLCLAVAPIIARGDTDTGIPLETLSYPMWMVSATVLLTVVFRLARSGRSTAAWLTGIGGGLAGFQLLSVPIGMVFGYIGPISSSRAYDVAAANLSYVDYSSAPMWFLNGVDGVVIGRYLDNGPTPQSFTAAVTGGLDLVVPVMLAATAFAVGYLISSARPGTAPVAIAEPVAETATRPATASPARQRAGAAVTVLGIATWAVILGFMTPASWDFDLSNLRDYGYWAIVLAAVGLVWARSGSRGSVSAGVGFGASVLAVGILIDRADLTGIGAFLLATGLAGGLAVAAWYLSVAMESRHPGTRDTRRTDIGIAIFAGYSAAAALAAPFGRTGFTPTGSATFDAWLPIIATVTAVSFAGIAVAATWRAREPRLSTRSAILLLGPLPLITAVLGWCTNYVGQVLWNVPPGVFLLVPVACYLTAVIGWGRRERTVVDWLKWGAAILTTAVGATVLFLPQAILGTKIGHAVLDLSVPGSNEWFGPPRMFGMLLAATALAVLAGARAGRGPRPATATAETPGPATGEVATA